MLSINQIFNNNPCILNLNKRESRSICWKLYKELSENRKYRFNGKNQTKLIREYVFEKYKSIKYSPLPPQNSNEDLVKILKGQNNQLNQNLQMVMSQFKTIVELMSKQIEQSQSQNSNNIISTSNSNNTTVINIPRKYDNETPLEAYWISGLEEYIINPTTDQRTKEPKREKAFRMRVSGMLKSTGRNKMDHIAEEDIKRRCSKSIFIKQTKLTMDFGNFKFKKKRKTLKKG